ncbi:helix-turn-helix domain-containing protein [Leptospira interrogans]|uniref:DNA-binding helix-turn-helix protein n=2 Tax=Leptospira interrogans serovar Pyrogenes TaxID=280500 RepID=M7ADL9_LEPIR|nr:MULTISPECIES: helix-turn-helix transcriptional regulator [Leptospira]EMN27863.1 DNA-binding helix-turn-helix protein [Leptospira interrogans serovar Pyrogenes str. L0374]EMP08919.1 DNA-binding helix-turn-helix protein [Leptospira interrogans serovar Pyrogenes str. 200701872]EKO08467.1 DNA-binding helix-turn-helix protein [Leptospira interrogans str. C10069]EMJ48451.1 DNA-binding helix-turn-helix protein [Leptospira interrogans str. UT126]EMN26957.1 DNA-binding helix-turn-helix protein [Lept
MKSPGLRIKYIRTEGLGKKLNQEEFASSIYISQSQLSKLENEENDVTEQTAFIIQIIHGYSMSWILKGKGPMNYFGTEIKEENLDLKFEAMNHIYRNISRYPKSKLTIEAYFKLKDNHRSAIDQIVVGLLSDK